MTSTNQNARMIRISKSVVGCWVCWRIWVRDTRNSFFFVCCDLMFNENDVVNQFRRFIRWLFIGIVIILILLVTYVDIICGKLDEQRTKKAGTSRWVDSPYGGFYCRSPRTYVCNLSQFTFYRFLYFNFVRILRTKSMNETE